MPDSARKFGRRRPIVLCILDGWGERVGGADNAIELARTPNWDRMTRDYPKARLNASALDVGLPDGQMGNSEVGHMNIGAGRVVMQDLPRINAAVADGSIGANPRLIRFTDDLRAAGGTCHILSLMSPGGVHAHQSHIARLARIIADRDIDVAIHAFLDGRDTPPSSAKGYIEQFFDQASAKNITVATISGRYYAMDRDNRWERVAQAHAAIADGGGEKGPDAISVIENAYAQGTTDEFVPPTVIGDYAGMNDGDGLLMANFRADRARQILTALIDPGFDGFTARRVRFSAILGMTEYSSELNAFMSALFPQAKLDNILGQVVADAGMTQLRIAETEKYAHVTFFLNGGEERVFAGEERILVPSPKVATYDLQPEMSAGEVTDRLRDEIAKERFDLIIANYANGDMVGHTGILSAAVKAVETVDACLGRLEAAVTEVGGTMLITADHGNVEKMRDPDSQQPHTAHTTCPVPLVMVNPPVSVDGLDDGILADIAPTILELLGLGQPVEMTGRTLATKAPEATSSHHATA